MQESDYDVITSEVQSFVPKIEEMSKNVTKIIGLIGATGSGKSTLTSYFQNAPMQFKKKFGGMYEIDHFDKTGKYAKIGHDMRSCTSSPSIFQCNGQFFVDLTGWFDTGNTNQQIINSYTNSAIFKQGKEVKIVIVVEINSIFSSRGGCLVDIMQRLAEFFREDLTMMINSIMLILSKVNTDDSPPDFVIGQITQICEINQNLDASTKTLLRNLIRNKKIMIFPQPDKIKNHIELIKNDIKSMKPTVLTHNGSISLSHRAINTVNSYLGFLNSKIAECSNKIALQIRQKYSNLNYKTGQQVNDDLCKLKKAQKTLKNQIGAFSSVGKTDEKNFLTDLKDYLFISEETSIQLNKNLLMVTFYKQLNGQINIGSSFVEIISLEVIQNIAKLQIIREKFTSEEERRQMEENHGHQMIERQKANARMVQQSEERMQKITLESENKIQKQRKQFEQNMKNQSDKYTQDILAMNKKIMELVTRPPQIVHVKGKKGGRCQIM